MRVVALQTDRDVVLGRHDLQDGVRAPDRAGVAGDADVVRGDLELERRLGRAPMGARVGRAGAGERVLEQRAVAALTADAGMPRRRRLLGLRLVALRAHACGRVCRIEGSPGTGIGVGIEGRLEIWRPGDDGTDEEDTREERGTRNDPDHAQNRPPPPRPSPAWPELLRDQPAARSDRTTRASDRTADHASDSATRVSDCIHEVHSSATPMTPRRRASFRSSTRSWKPSFSMAVDRLEWTDRSLRWRALAISRLVWPTAARRRTSRSRSVSVS